MDPEYPSELSSRQSFFLQFSQSGQELWITKSRHDTQLHISSCVWWFYSFTLFIKLGLSLLRTPLSAHSTSYATFALTVYFEKKPIDS